MENILTDFIRPELLVLIPVLFFVGKFLKSSKTFDDKHIPLMLGVISIALCILETLAVSNITNYHEALSAVFTAITQGLICAGCSVYAHQLLKQYSSDKPCSVPPSDNDTSS